VKTLGFIIPVRHQDNSSDWNSLIENLKQTMDSINNQSDPDWKCVIVANEGARLPELPPKFEVKRVDFPPNEFHERGTVDLETFRDVFRLDKGKRVLEGMKHAKDSRYFMIVDDDDLVHRDLVEFAKNNSDKNGWFIKRGLVWNSGGNLLMLHNNFHRFCGTSHIVRSDLIDLEINQKDNNHEYIKRILGSHMSIEQELSASGNMIDPLPFHGAIYRVGHSNAHSKSPRIFRTFIANKNTLKSPKTLIKSIIKLRLLTRKIKDIYFGIPMTLE
jgi:glycosyltransferase involved in cell wall biosynthesis